MERSFKHLVNMAESISKLMECPIERLDISRHSIKDIEPFYTVDVWLTNGHSFTIRNDCTIYER